jgi:hypothetical protein
MKIRLIFIKLYLSITILASLSNCSTDSTEDFNTESDSSYQETKLTLEEQERANPLSFLSTDGTYKKNLIGEWVLNGTIYNSASIATYKDATLEVYFYSKTNTLIGKEKHSIYEYFAPGKTKSFKIKTYGYKGTSSIGWEIINASSE